MAPRKKAGHPAQSQVVDSYEHKTADSPMRPDVGTQAQVRKRKPPKSYSYGTFLAQKQERPVSGAFNGYG